MNENKDRNILKFNEITLESDKKLNSDSNLKFKYNPLNKELNKELKIKFYDLIYFSNVEVTENDIEDKNKYTITMPIDLPHKKYKVVKVNKTNDDKYEIDSELDTVYDKDNKTLSFTTDELGDFAIYGKSRKLGVLPIIVPVIIALGLLGYSYANIPEFRDKVNQFFNDVFDLDTPSAPVIAGGSEEWVKSALIYVTKDAKVGGTGKLDHYVYCINDTTNPKKCSWFRTDTKNVLVGKQGIHYVWFKGVNDKGVMGAISNMEKVKIDADGPNIKNVEYEEITQNRAVIKVDIEDGKEYYYQVNGGEIKKFNGDKIILENLEPNTEYVITIIAIDENGNETRTEITIKTNPGDENSDEDTEEKQEENEEEEKKEEEESEDYEIKGDIIYSTDVPNDQWSMSKYATITCPKGTKNDGYSLDGGKTWNDYTGPVLFTDSGFIMGRCSNAKNTIVGKDFEVKLIDPKIPELSLEGIPTTFTYQESYQLPTSFKFGISNGTVTCKASGVSYEDTMYIPVGRHELVCTAISGAGAKTEKKMDIEVTGQDYDDVAGWVTLTLKYPKKSIKREWKVKDSNTYVTYQDIYYQWHAYTGPIRIRVEDVEKVIIRYEMDGETIVESPSGLPVVDITPDSYILDEGDETKVTIYYDSRAVTKQYRINGLGWKDYTGPFKVGPNTSIEAKVQILTDVYDDEGEVITQRKVENYDAALIEKNPPWDGNVELTCPGTLGIGELGECTVKFNGDFDAKLYRINGTSSSFIAYTGTGTISNVKAGDTIVVKGTKIIAGKQKEVYASATIGEKENNSIVIHCPSSLPVGEITECTIDYSTDFDVKEYRVNGTPTNFTSYTGAFNAKAGDTITARGTRVKDGQPYETIRVLRIEAVKGNIRIDAVPEIPAKGSTSTITITYDELMTIKQYRVKELNDPSVSEWKIYDGPFEAGPGAVIEARGQIPTLDMVYVTKILDQNPYFLSISASNYTPKFGSKSTVTIYYSPVMTVRKYRIDKGPWKDYTGSFEVDPNTEVDAWGYASEYNDVYASIKIGEAVYVPSWELPLPDIYLEDKPGDYRYSIATIVAPRPAREIKYAIGNSRLFKTYNGPFDVKKGTSVYAYYVDEELGIKSKINSKGVPWFEGGGGCGNGPIVQIYGNPDRYDNVRTDKVTISISAGGASSIEYSLDGIVWLDYTRPFEVYKNGTIYARATSYCGTGGNYYVVNYIEDIPPVTSKDLSDILITANPTASGMTPNTTDVDVTITYDSRATTKYYRIGSGDSWHEYTGQFSVSSNTTIYAYQETPSGKNDAMYKIDWLSSGYADPIIKVLPNGSSKKILIDYDKNAIKNTYSIDGKDFEDYSSPFIMEENGVIYAKSEFADGTVTTQVAFVTNISNSSAGRVRTQVEQDYIIVYLNYPENSAPASRKYKYKEDGLVTKYKEDGILLIKQNKVSDIVDADGNAYINVDGVKTKFNGDYYILDVDETQIWEHIFMMWEDGTTEDPEIFFDNDGALIPVTQTLEDGTVVPVTETLEDGTVVPVTERQPSHWAKEVEVSIHYPKSLKLREYRIVKPDGTDTGWLEYDEPFTVDESGTIIFARGFNSGQVVSNEVSRIVTHVDSGNPGMRLMKVISKTMNSITIQFTPEDKEGTLDKILYSVDGENWDEANTTLYTYENLKPSTTYTLFAKAIDEVGNESRPYYITAKTKPITAPTYEVTPAANEWSQSKTIEINYIDGNYNKEYSIDRGHTWQTYTSPITINEPSLILARISDSDGNITYGSTLSLTRIDNTEPEVTNVSTITTSSKIIVTAEAKDEDSGILRYYYSVDGVNYFTSYDSTYSISNLYADTEYDVYVKAENLSGMISQPYKVKDKTIEIAEPIYPIVKSFDDQHRRFFNTTTGDKYLVNENNEIFALDNLQEFDTEGNAMYLNDPGYVPEYSYNDGTTKNVEDEKDEVTEIDNFWAYTKEITINYPYVDDDCQNQYAIVDTHNPNNLVWHDYVGPVTVDKEDMAIIARVISGPNDVRASSTVNLGLIDRTEPTISININPISIEVGADKPLPTTFAGDPTKSGANAKCWLNDNEKDVIDNTKYLRSGWHNINCRVTTGAGHSVLLEHKQPVYPSLKIPVDSILQGIFDSRLDGKELTDGDFYFDVINGTSTTRYTIELWNYEGNTTLSEPYEKDKNGNIVLDSNGNKVRKKFCDNVSDIKMCVLRFKGDLTIDPDVILTPQVRKKGFTVIVDGKLTNNGTITNSKNGLPGEGENVYLWKNTDGTYEYVPAVGGQGALEALQVGTGSKKGNTGLPAVDRSTGGGGSGGTAIVNNNVVGISGAGGRGTSYSGGSGGGAAIGASNVVGRAASNDATAGATGAVSGTSHYAYSGGAGNPTAESNPYIRNQENGAGGLLNIYAATFNNNGVIDSNGVDSPSITTGSKYFHAAGGASGGGSINIFYNNIENKGTIEAKGGQGGKTAGASLQNADGGDGAAGRVTLSKIVGNNVLGSEALPYEINNEEDFINAINTVKDYSGAAFTLNSDLDLSGYDIEPFGNIDHPFTGVFNGNNHVISNLTLSSEQDNFGLFGVVSAATIKDLKITNASVSGKDNVGILAGSVYDGSTIENIEIDGSVHGNDNIGGSIGIVMNTLDTTLIKEVITDVTIDCRDNIGGLIGKVYSVRNGKVYIQNNGTNVDITATGNNIGGLVGEIDAPTSDKVSVTSSYSDGTAKGNDKVGGLIGNIETDNDGVISINKVQSSVDVEGNDYVAGLIAKAQKTMIGNSYSVGDVKAHDYAGSFVADIKDTAIENTYAIGKVDSELVKHIGGFAGVTEDSVVTNSYFSSQTTNVIKTAAGINLRVPLLVKQSSYNGYNFENVWSINEDNTTAFLQGMPIPDEIYHVNISYNEMTGKGTAQNPYTISNATELMEINNELDAYYEIINDIDLTGIDFDPIGQENFAFTGVLIGNNHKITNLNVDKDKLKVKDNVGLFEVIEDATITDLTIESANVSGDNNAGLLAGKALGSVTIDNVKVTGNLDVENAENLELLIIPSQVMKPDDVATTIASATGVKENDVKKFLLGAIDQPITYITKAEASQIRNAKLAGVYVIEGRVGGLLGAVELSDSYATLITNIDSNVTIDSDGERVGGLIGDIIINDSVTQPIQIQNINVDSTINSTSDYVGGTIGLLTNYGTQSITINNIENNGKITANSNVGGSIGKIINHNTGTITIDNIKTDNPIVATGEYVGGAIGYFHNAHASTCTIDIIECTNDVEGAANTGGVIGKLQSTIPEKVYASGENIVTNINSTGAVIKGTDQVGGAIGLVDAQETGGYSGNNTISYIYSTSEVRATGTEIGGLIGKIQADLKNTNYKNVLEKAYATGEVHGSTKVGGLIGVVSYSKVNDTFQTGTITASNQVGAYSGELSASEINNSYAIGKIYTNGKKVGGFAATAKLSTVTNSYFSSQTTGYIKTAAGINNKLYKLLKQATYSNYDFTDTWAIDNGATTAYLQGLPKPSSVDESAINYNKMLGSGTQEDPYQIWTPADLNDVRNEATAYYVVKADIDMEGYTYDGINPMRPIGEESAPFSGVIDGEDHIISNYTYSVEDDNVGLFSMVSNGTIKNLTLDNINITGYNNVGILAGNVDNGITVDNVTVSNSTLNGVTNNVYTLVIRKDLVTNKASVANYIYKYTGTNYNEMMDYLNGLEIIQPLTMVTSSQATNINKENLSGVYATNGNVGGLIGTLNVKESNDAIISNVETDIDINTDANRIGGIIGDVTIQSGSTNGLEISNVVSAPVMAGAKQYSGGIIGLATNNSDSKLSLTNVKTEGEISGTNYVGGSIGRINNNSTGLINLYIIENEAVMSNSEAASYVAGVVGHIVSNKTATVTIEQSSNKSDVTGRECTAGVVGCVTTSGNIISIKTLENEGNIVGKNNTGGIIGKIENAGTSLVDICALSNKGDVFGEEGVGGLIGSYINQTTGELLVDTSWSKDGTIKGTLNVGGLIGLAYNTTTGKINIDASYSKSDVENTGMYTGGLVGQLYSNGLGTIGLSKTYATGQVKSAGYYAGGLVGSIKNKENNNATVEKSYATGYLKASSYSGGLIGQILYVDIKDTFATGGYENITKDDDTPTVTDYIGGLVGSGKKSNIDTSYAMGRLKVNGQVLDGIENYKKYSTGYNTGGIIGGSEDTIVTDTYFSGQSVGIIRGTNGIIKTTPEMLKQATFNFDFTNTWTIEEDDTLPYLQELEKPNDVNKSNYTIHEYQGSGTEQDPYLIYNLEDLNYARFELDKHYKLMNDIDLTIDNDGTRFVSIGEELQPFTGELDGNNHTIKNGGVDAFDDSVGLFGATRGATIKDLTLKDIEYFENENVGSLIGTAFDGVTIKNVNIENTNSINATNAGGLIGYFEQINEIDSVIENVNINIEVSGDNAGGLIGYLNNNSVSELNISDIEVLSKINGKNNAGGLIGYNKSVADNDITIEGVTISGEVTQNISVAGNHNIGGIIGKNDYQSNGTLTIDDINITGTVSIDDITVAKPTGNQTVPPLVTESNIGGLIGNHNVTVNGSKTKITNVSVSGTINPQNVIPASKVTITQNLGGLIGRSYLDDAIDDSTNKAELEVSLCNVSADIKQLESDNDLHSINGTTGGLIGSNESNSLGKFEVNKSYVTSDIKGNDYVGGLVGKNVQKENGNNVIELSYTTGSVKGHDYIGGLVGYENSEVFSTTEINRCYTTGVIEGNDQVGGMIGYIENANTNDTYSTSKVKGDTNVAAYAGKANNVSVNNSYAVGEVTATGTTIGGFVSYATDSESNNSYFSSDSTKLFRTAIGMNVRMYNLVNAKNVYNGWDFTDVWEIDLGNTIAYLKDLPIPDSVNAIYYDTSRYSGEGTIGDEYEIYTPDDLSNMRVELHAHYKLMNDLDMTGYNFYPIGEDNQVFEGTLDGQGYTIRNLEINDTGLFYNGLFGEVDGVSIRNLNIENMTVTSTKENTGSLIGHSKGDSIIDNVTIESTITSTEGYTGGLIGKTDGNTSITNVEVETTITSTGISTGGLVGELEDTKADETIINDNKVVATITSTGNVGGVVGYINNVLESQESINIADIIENVTITGTPTSEITNIGGVVGYINEQNQGTEVVIENISNLNGDIIVNDPVSGEKTINTGGVVGYSYTNDGDVIIQNIENNIEINNQYEIADNSEVTSATGGVIGNNVLYGNGNININTIAAKGEITDISTMENGTRNTHTGGIIGITENELSGKVIVSDSYVSGDINATSYVGGIVGYIYDKNTNENRTKTEIIDVYTHHNINAEGSYVGGLVGSLVTYDEGIAKISRSYASGTIQAEGLYIGGAMGQAAYAQVYDVYSTSSVEGKDYVSSLIGASGYSVYENVYAIGEVKSSGKTVGSIISYSAEDIFANAYYSSETTNLTSSRAGINVAFSRLLKEITYNNYNFVNTWTIDEDQTTAYLQGKPNPQTDSTIYQYSDLQGSGTLNDPYLIHDYVELRAIGLYLDAVYSIENDIEAPAGSRFLPLGSDEMPFTGTILGNNHTISNITIDSEQNDASMFGYTQDATIKDLKLENINVKGRYYVATLMGRANGNTTIEDVEVHGGTVTAIGDNTAGIVAKIINTDTNKVTLKNITQDLDLVDGNDNVGGIVSEIANSISGEIEVTNVYSKSAIKGKDNVGGVIGYMNNTGLGIVNLTRLFSYNDIDIKVFSVFDDMENAGGIIGYSKGTASGPVILTKSYSDASVTGDTYVGGLIGKAEYTSVANSASTGDFGGELATGGLIGYVDNCTVNNTYSYSVQTSYDKSYGGLIGLEDDSTITNSYYSSEINIEKSSIGTDLPISDVTSSASYVGFDFVNVWGIDEGETVPYLIGLNVTNNQKTVPETITTFEADSVLDAVSKSRLRSSIYHFLVNGKDYEVHSYVFDGDQHWTSDMTFGTKTDIAKNNRDAQRMVVVKVNGNLTIDEGVTVGPFYSQYGGPKGFTLYVTGTLTNNGIIDNSHGAKAAGEDVYLWKNADGSYEYVPAVGASGAARLFANEYQKVNGRNGNDATGRQTGGGATGSGWTPHYWESTYAGAGGNGTSYSGGAGGGAAFQNGRIYAQALSGAGSSTGGIGGGGATTNSATVGGGAGNPGGNGGTIYNTYSDGVGLGNYAAAKGEDGTGGLLTIFSEKIINNGSITANGSKGGAGGQGSGGASGGGSINLFYRVDYTGEGTVVAAGGESTSSTADGPRSGIGGNGSITYTEMIAVLANPTPIYTKVEPEVFTDSKMSVEIQKDAAVQSIKYSLDDGNTWLDYENDVIIDIGSTIKYKGILLTGIETKDYYYTATLDDDLDELARDGNMETIYQMPANSVERFDVSSELINRTLFVYIDGDAPSNAKLEFYNNNDEVLKTYTFDSSYNRYRIPFDCAYVKISSGNNILPIKEVVNRKTSINRNLPEITMDKIGWANHKNITINYPACDNCVNEYSVDNGETWQEYTGTITLNDNANVFARITNNGQFIASSSFNVTMIDPASIEGDSLLSIVRDNNLNGDNQKLVVNGELYHTHYYEFNGDQQWTENMTFGDENDVATASEDAKNMVIVKVNGDLTINEGVTVEPFHTEYGGPKGFMLYVTGSLINNGTIDNSHGAKAKGQNVYIWKNNNGTYEYVPAEGAAGGAKRYSGNNQTNNGNPGVDGTGRQTGGGASGEAAYGDSGYGAYSGAGTAGTSYSGGTGGGGVNHNSTYTLNENNDGKPNGGAGGNGIGHRYSTSWAWRSAGGGAGNPGGPGGESTVYDGNGNSTAANSKGEDGTGGLLIIYADSMINNSDITAYGSKGASYGITGGSSGGGSVNIFCNTTCINSSLIMARGGDYGNDKRGGKGGNGSVNMGTISDGNYTDLSDSLDVITGDSILSIVEKNKFVTGYYTFSVNGTRYPVHLYNYNEDQVITSNKQYGDDSDCASGMSEDQMATRMVIVKVNGNMTINSGVTVGPYYTQYGGPKGFMLYVSGTLTNNGTIDNSHGAYAEGQDVYLWKNSDDSYEYIPALGASGGEGTDEVNNLYGKDGTDGSLRTTGGGGAYRGYSPPHSLDYINPGASGTSYSGGVGAGTSGSGQPSMNGGASAVNPSGNYISGAGNPASVSGFSLSGYAPSNGTGGLLAIYANDVINSGTISAKGARGGTHNHQGSGSSGGGSVNIFYKNDLTPGTIDVDGGVKTVCPEGDKKGGAGGTGSIAIGLILDGTYIETYHNW